MELDYVKLKEIKPVLSGYIRESQLLLKASVVPGEKVVHDVRVNMKKLRAVLKLIAAQIDKESFDREIHAFREVGRIMSSWRETSVCRKTLKEIRKDEPALFLKLIENEKLSSLLKKPEPVQEPSEETKAALLEINDLLTKAGFRLRFQAMDKFDPQLLIRELEITYDKVTDIYLTSRNSLKPATIHEFRKRAKDFLYQICFFRPLNPPVINGIEKSLESMTQNLGKYNDLTQLIRALGYKYQSETNLPAMDELVIKIRERQDRYLEKVWPIAYKIFCPGQRLVNVLGFKILVI
jgi:CHAD domain-containing protein